MVFDVIWKEETLQVEKPYFLSSVSAWLDCHITKYREDDWKLILSN
jgi:hypothetical protein